MVGAECGAILEKKNSGTNFYRDFGSSITNGQFLVMPTVITARLFFTRYARLDYFTICVKRTRNGFHIRGAVIPAPQRHGIAEVCVLFELAQFRIGKRAALQPQTLQRRRR